MGLDKADLPFVAESLWVKRNLMAPQGLGYKNTKLRTKGIELIIGRSHHHEMVEHKEKGKKAAKKG